MNPTVEAAVEAAVEAPEEEPYADSVSPQTEAAARLEVTSVYGTLVPVAFLSGRDVVP